ncbi:MAG TPA: hypothetical protein VF060_11630 [Trebonia sp.]
MRIGIVGSSVAVIGWAAALAALAPSAGATPGQASSANYDSTATAKVGEVNIAGTDQSLLTTTATSGDSPKSASIGSGQVLSALKGVPSLGSALAAAFQQANSGNTDLVSESATASHDGTSTACAAILSADCTTRPMSLSVKLGLTDLTSALNGSPLAGLIKQLPDSVDAYTVVLTLNGPWASCSAGPAGSGDVSATDNPGGASLDIRANGKSALPNGPVALSGGAVFSQVLTAVKGSPVTPLLQMLTSKASLTLTLNPTSRKYTSGSTATATADEIGLSSGGTTIFDVKLATVTCGPNTEAAGATPAPGPSESSPSTGSTSGEKPLSEIQTDEGRSSIPAAQSYLALNGMP